jgi:predicted DNA-binding protein
MYTAYMRPTTTIRVDAETHARLVSLSQSTGHSLLATVREAAEALQRQRLANRVADELAALRADPRGWSEYLAEAEATQVPDGID